MMACRYAETSALKNRRVLRDGLFNKYINCSFTFKWIFETFVMTPLLVVIHLQFSAYKAQRTKGK
jgi:hypothetical protein